MKKISDFEFPKIFNRHKKSVAIEKRKEATDYIRLIYRNDSKPGNRRQTSQ